MNSGNLKISKDKVMNMIQKNEDLIQQIIQNPKILANGIKNERFVFMCL